MYSRLRNTMTWFLWIFMLTIIPFQGMSTELPLQSEVFFSPNPNFFSPLLSLIDGEKELIQIATSRLTDRHIWNALIKASARGVAIEIIVDTKTLSIGKLLQKLSLSKSQIWVYPEIRQNKTRTIMNHKFCICKSQSTVWNASCSFSPSAKQHCEHALLVRQSNLVHQFAQEFEKLKQKSILLEATPSNK